MSRYRTSGEARAAALDRWATEPDRLVATSAGRSAFLRSFEDKVDPDGLLTDAERKIRAEAALRAHMTRLAERSAEARRR